MWFLDTYLDLGPVKNAKSKPKSMFPIAWRFCSCLHAVSGDFSTFSCSSLTTWTWPKICSGCLVLGWFDWCLRLLLGGLISNTTTPSEEVRTSRLQIKTTWNKRVIAAQEKIMTSRWNEHARKWSCWLLACIELRGPCSGHVRALQKCDSEILQLMQLLQLALNLLECGSHPQPSHFVGLHISWFRIDCRLWLRFKDCGNPICLNSAILCLQLPASEVWELCADRGRRRLFQLKLGIQRYSHVIF